MQRAVSTANVSIESEEPMQLRHPKEKGGKGDRCFSAKIWDKIEIIGLHINNN